MSEKDSIDKIIDLVLNNVSPIDTRLEDISFTLDNYDYIKLQIEQILNLNSCWCPK